MARMFGLSQYDAAQKLNQDFSLGIEIHPYKKKSKPKKKKIAKTEQERATFVKQKNSAVGGRSNRDSDQFI